MYDLAATEFANRVERATKGMVRIRVEGNAKLGNDQQLLAKVVANELTFCLPASALVPYSETFAVFDLPYLVITRDHIRRVRKPLLDRFLIPSAASKGIAVLGMWENGFRQVTNNIRPIKAPGDFKGLKLRVPQGAWRAVFFKTYGAEVRELAADKLYDALKNGDFDGQENTLSNIVYTKYFEQQKYLSMTNHIYQPIFLVSSPKQMQALTRATRAKIEAIARELQDWHLDAGAAEDKKLLALLEGRLQRNDVDTIAFLTASLPIYTAFSKEVPEGRAMIELLYDPHSLEFASQPSARVIIVYAILRSAPVSFHASTQRCAGPDTDDHVKRSFVILRRRRAQSPVRPAFHRGFGHARLTAPEVRPERYVCGGSDVCAAL